MSWESIFKQNRGDGRGTSSHTPSSTLPGTLGEPSKDGEDMTCNGTICDQRTLVVPYGAESFSTGFVDICGEIFPWQDTRFLRSRAE